MMWLPKFINTPRKFENIAKKVLPYLLITFLLSFVIGAVWGLFFTPPDYLQRDLAKIMYVHVPAAWFSMFCYSLLALLSSLYVIWRHPLSLLLAKSTAVPGILLGVTCLLTGSVWGYPAWGAWWVWDARLTSMLVLVLLFIGYLLVQCSFDNEEQGAVISSWLAVIGFINIPIVKFSVDWWNSLHQSASISRLGKPAIASELLWPLLFMTLAYFCFVMLALLKNALLHLNTRRIRRQSYE